MENSVGMYLALATSHGNVHEAAGVQDALVGATLGVLLLLLGLDLCSKFQLGWVSDGWARRPGDRADGRVICGRCRVALGGSEGVLALGVAALTLPARAREP